VQRAARVKGAKRRGLARDTLDPREHCATDAHAVDGPLFHSVDGVVAPSHESSRSRSHVDLRILCAFYAFIYMGPEFARPSLTQRDVRILERIVLRRGVPIDLLADEFFYEDPFTCERNRDPVRACERRLRALAKAGLVIFAVRSDGAKRRRLVLPGNGMNGLRLDGSKTIARASKRRPSARETAHHIKTQDAVRALEKYAQRHGWRVVSVKLAADLRVEKQRGYGRFRRDPSSSFPDALCGVQFEDGQSRRSPSST